MSSKGHTSCPLNYEALLSHRISKRPALMLTLIYGAPAFLPVPILRRDHGRPVSAYHMSAAGATSATLFLKDVSFTATALSLIHI